MPPTRVLMSTCLSSPFASFFTLTLQAGRSSSSVTTEAANNHRELAVFGGLAIGILRSSTSDVSLLSPGEQIDEGESRSFAGFRGLDGDNVLVVFCARFQFHDVAGSVAGIIIGDHQLHAERAGEKRKIGAFLIFFVVLQARARIQR